MPSHHHQQGSLVHPMIAQLRPVPALNTKLSVCRARPFTCAAPQRARSAWTRGVAAMSGNALFDVYVKGEEDKLGDCEWAAACARLFMCLESLLAAVCVTPSA